MKEPTPLYGAGAYVRYEFTIDGHRVAAYTEVTEETWVGRRWIFEVDGERHLGPAFENVAYLDDIKELARAFMAAHRDRA